MSLGSWDPDADAAAKTLTADHQTLQRLISYSRAGQLESLTDQLGSEDSQTLAGLMHLDKGEWQQAAESLSDEELLHLIRFFAVAENLAGWEAGDKSPVIPLAKVMRQRGRRLDKEFLQWLRSVNENRYLPYGPL